MTPAGIPKDVKAEHPLNACASMVNEYVAEQSKFTEVRALQLKKAPSPIIVTEAGRVMDVRLVAPKKTPLPMVVIEAGMVMDVRPET